MVTSSRHIGLIRFFQDHRLFRYHWHIIMMIFLWERIKIPCFPYQGTVCDMAYRHITALVISFDKIYIILSTLFSLFIIMSNISPAAKPSTKFCIFSPFNQDAWRDSTQTSPSSKYKNCFQSGSWRWYLFEEKTKPRRLFRPNFINKNNSQSCSAKGRGCTDLQSVWLY